MKFKWILSVLLAVMPAIASCAGMVTTIRLEIPGLGVIEVTVQGQSPSRTLTIVGDAEATGACVEVTFVDADGNTVGTATTTVGSTIPMPASAVSGDVTSCEPEEDFTPEPGGRRRGKAASVGKEYTFWGVPTQPDLEGVATTYVMTIRSRDAAGARTLRDVLLRTGTSSPLPPGVELHHVSRVSVVDGDVVIVLADDDPFESVQLGLNGDPVYATTEDASFWEENGWYLAAFEVPVSEVALDLTPGGAWSASFDIVHRSRGSSGAQHVSGVVEVLP